MTMILLRRLIPMALAALLALLAWTAVHRSGSLPELIYVHLPNPNERDPILYHLALGCDDYWSLCSHTPTRLIDRLHPSYPVVSWSPDGAYIAARARDTRWLFYRADCLLTPGATCEPTVLPGDSSDIRLAWGVDGSVVALPNRDGSLLNLFTRGCWDGSPPSACGQWTIDPYDPDSLVALISVTMPDWSADGRWLAFLDGFSTIALLPAACLADPPTCAGQIEQITPPIPPFWVTLSSDGERVLYFANGARDSRTQIYLYDRRTQATRRLTPRREEAAVMDWSADDRYLAYSAGFRDNLVIAVMDMARGIRVRMMGSGGWHLYPSWGVSRSE